MLRHLTGAYSRKAGGRLSKPELNRASNADARGEYLV